jgi:DNA-binding MarR family transcriptional regulator
MYKPVIQSEVTGYQLYDGLDRLVRFVRQIDGSTDLSSVAASVLRRLDRDGSQAVMALARAERASQPNMTQLMLRLERDGLVVRSTDPDDRRVTLVEITDQGREALAERRDARARALQPLIDRLDENDRAALRDALPAIDHLIDSEQEPQA